MRPIQCLIGVAVVAAPFMAPDAHAAGAWTGGQDILHVPLSWCAVQGSPAAANPNILSIGATTPDTTTDTVLWRRHERPTDNIFINPSGISFRSAINNTWGTLNFPIIADPDTTLGVQGDMRGEDVNVVGVEFNQLINDCDAAWTALGRAGIGVTAINANLFHDGAGTYVGVIGWGGCTRSVMTGNCVAPYDGRVVLIDNNYLYPTVADRTFPPSPGDPAGSLQFIITDALDQLAGHEFGHALSLPHRANVMALMNPTVTDNDGDGVSDNIALSAAEVTQLRTNALGVPGLESDPPGIFVAGNFVRTRIPDEVGENADLPAHLDLAAVNVTLDKAQDALTLGAQLFGVIPDGERQPVTAWFLLDTDDGQGGIPPDRLKQLGLPGTPVAGVDLAIRVEVTGTRVQGTGWRLEGREVRQIRDRLVFDLQRLIMDPYLAPIEGRRLPQIGAAPIYDIIVVTLPNQFAGLALDRAFNVQVVLARPGQVVTDRFDETPEQRGIRFVLEEPSFPHCFVDGNGEPGGLVPIRFEGLVPNRGVHGLIGPIEVVRGMADDDGSGRLDFPIPADVHPGLHLVTIGTDDTALTADCTVEVVPPRRERPPLGPREFSLVKSLEDLLKGQQDLLEELGDIVRETLATRPMSDAEALSLTESYQRLIQQQSELIVRFESLVREATR